jgi:predicted NBD/HSP70 family sugar kinase
MLTGRPQRMKQVNEALIREALRLRGRATKADIARDSGLSQTTVTQALSQMEALGQIRQVGFRDSSGGRKAAVYELDANAGRGYALAIELDHIDWAVCNALGTVISEGSRLVREDPVQDAISLLAKLRDSGFERPQGSDQRVALAIGVPGAVVEGSIITGSFKPKWGETDVVRYIAGATGLPTLVENDMNAIALGYAGEAETGGRKLHSLIYIHINEGPCTGSGLVYEGRILKGAANFAGELGYMPVPGGTSLDQALRSAASNEEYVAAISAALAAVTCVMNPALIVIGGTFFRFDLSDALTTRFATEVDAAVRPDLSFVRDSRPYYLSGLCGLAAESLFPAYRLINTRS